MNRFSARAWGWTRLTASSLVSMLERDYGILIEEMSVAQKAFASVRTLAEFVAKNRKN